jgi:hypothetical protein
VEESLKALMMLDCPGCVICPELVIAIAIVQFDWRVQDFTAFSAETRCNRASLGAERLIVR